MKIEMGESLFYSWLRHVKECQIVQTNWKVSPQWTLQHEEDLQEIMRNTDEHFERKYSYKIFKKNSSLSQILQQGECDAIGISIQSEKNSIYAVDVAFHEAGLNYGTREETVMKVCAKIIRSAMCIWGYLGMREGNIIFASPKINPAILKDLQPCIEDINKIFESHGFEFKTRIITNEEFNDSVLQPILLVSEGVADTSELFLRSYQMYKMFEKEPRRISNIKEKREQVSRNPALLQPEFIDESIYKELKIGKLAQLVFRKLLEEGKASVDEVYCMQQANYSKRMFDLQYPVLVKADGEYEDVRYYKNPLYIRGEKYLMCSQWFEVSTNNDRPYLLKWIEEHTKE